MRWEVQIGGGEGLIGRTCDRSGQESLGEEITFVPGFSCPAVFFFFLNL